MGVNGIDSFTCQCPPTYEGTDCSTRVCPADYCLNGGTCTVTLGITFVCRCPIHTEGLRCEYVNEVTDFVIQAGACTGDYCKNGGTCIPGTNATAILCRCPPNTAGNQCELAGQVPAFDGVKTGLIIASSIGAALLIGVMGWVLFRYA
uniref:Epidermal growth factor (EGF)-like n=1 Tax=Lubomirskia baikalensis TaxID=289074 RepID=A4F3R6_9METZ|nr:epidermal growth factor (EGF)-like precursor [Lubomirskia baikalensis]